MTLVDLDPAGIAAGPSVSYIKGGFDLGATSVPFYSTCLQVGQLHSLLRLPSQLPVDPAHPIELEELFQRELDTKRVEGQIVKYLQSEDHLRFFNALTVVLLPLDPHNPRRLARSYPANGGLAPDGRADLEHETVGPITISHRAGNDSVGFLDWNLNLTLPVVLDGQHRFRAMQLILNEPSGKLRDELSRVRISVLFLILDSRAGFRSSGEISVVNACREIFIDLNKHARTVPRARLLLLDDRDISSVATRAVLAKGVDLTGKPVTERVAEAGRLPLALVDWRGVSAKFDASPYLSSLLTLHDMVGHVAAVGRFDPQDHAKARETVEKLVARFGLEDVEGFDVAALNRAIDEAEAAERPFELPRDAVRVAADAFRARFGQRIVLPLTTLAPYAELIAALKDAGVLASTLEAWLSFNADERRALVTELGVEDPQPRVDRAWQSVKRERYPLAFQVVFQKAIIYSLNALMAWPDALAAHWLLEPMSEDRLISKWISRFNETVAPALGVTGRESAFYGTGIRFDETIDFRKTRIRSITGFLSYCMLAPLPEWVEALRNEQLDEEEVKDWIRQRWALISPGRRDPISGLFSTHGKNWRNSVDEIVIAELDAEGQDPEDEERAERRVEHAARQMIRVAQQAAATDA